MKSTLLLALQLSCAALLEAQAPSFQWARTGSPINQSQFGRQVVTDHFGSVYLLGFNYGSAQFPDQLLDSGNFIAKYRHDGQFIWSKWVPGWISAIEVDRDGYLYVGGNYTGSISVDHYTHISKGESDFFLCRLGANGNVVWSKSFGGVGKDALRDLSVNNDNFVHIAGEVTGPFSMGGIPVQDTGYFISRLGSDSKVVWALTRPSYTVTAYNGSVIRYHSQPAYEIENDNAGNIYTLREIPNEYAPTYNLSKYNSSGKELLDTNMWGSFEWPGGLTFDSKDNMYVMYGTGSHYTNSTDLIKYNTKLQPTWQVELGSSYSKCEFNSGFTIGPDDNITLLGRMCGGMGFSDDTVTFNGVKYPPFGNMDAAIGHVEGASGQIKWLKRAGGRGDDFFEGICSDKAGNLIIVGTSQYPGWNNSTPDIDTCLFDGVILPIANKTGQAVVAKIRTSDYEFTYDAAGVADHFTDKRLTMFPNPGNGIVSFSGPGESGQVLAIDAFGRKVTEENFSGKQIDLSHLNNGVYFIRLTVAGRIFTGTYVRQ